MIDAVLIAATAGSRAEAEMIARTLVERRLAACVQLSAVDSLYHWQGEVKQAAEVLLLIKTTAERAEEAETCLARLSSYDTPEIVRLPIAGGSARYLAWVAEAVGGPWDADPLGPPPSGPDGSPDEASEG